MTATTTEPDTGLTIYRELEQRSPEWFAARCGLITASALNSLLTTEKPDPLEADCYDCGAEKGLPCMSKRKPHAPISTIHPPRTAAVADMPSRIVVADNDTSRALTATLAFERLAGFGEDSYISGDMWRGITEEPRAVERYAETQGVEVETCGLMVRDFGGYRLGYSPDGLVGEDGLIEVKAPRGKNHLLTVLDGEVPSHNMAQLQAGLLVSGRKWIDFIPWCGGLPLWTKRVYPDPNWHAAIIAAVQTFERNAAELVAAYKQATNGLPTTERAPDLEMN